METEIITITTPRPFREIPGLWLKVFQMDETFFADEATRASAGNTFWSVVLCGGVLAVGILLIFLLINSGAGYSGNSELGIVILIYTVIMIPALLVSFYLNAGLMSLGAQIFGGKGNFGTLAYLVSLFYVPLFFISIILALIPYLGALIALGFGIYQIVLCVRAIKVVYKLGTGRAVGALFAPAIVLLFIPVCVIVILALLGPAIGTIFSNVVEAI